MPAPRTRLDVIDTLTANSTKPIKINVDAASLYSNIKVGFYTAGGVLVTNAQLVAEVTNIRLLIDSVPVLDVSPAALQRFYSMYPTNFAVSTSTPGTLELNLANYLFSRDPIARKLFSLVMGGVRQAFIVITTSAIPNVAGVRVRTTIEPLPVNPSTNILQFTPFTESPRLEFSTQQIVQNTTGDITVPPQIKDQNRVFYMLNVTPGASGVIASSQLKAGNTIIRESLETAVNAAVLNDYGIAQPTGHYTHMLCTASDPGQGIRVVSTSDVNVIANFTTAPGAAGFAVETLSGVNVPPALASQMNIS